MPLAYWPAAKKDRPLPDLAAFQRDFANAVTSPGAPSCPFRSPAFAVYRNTTARGVVEGLRATFPTIDMLLGSEMFGAVALDFWRAAPPLSPIISDYGKRFPAFLASQPWSAEFPYLRDVAQLDWLWLRCFLAEDGPAVPRRVTAISEVRLHPAARFAWLGTPAMTIWLAHREQDGFSELSPDWREEGALFTRPNLEVRAWFIDRADYQLLQACASPRPLRGLETSLKQQFPGRDIPAAIRRCSTLGALIIV